MPELAPRTSNLKPSSSYRPAPPPNSGSSSSGGRGPYPPAPTKPQGKQGKPAKRKDTPSPNRTSGGKLHKGANTNAHGQTHSGGGAITASQAWSNYQPPAPAHPPSSSPNSAPHFPMPYNSKQQTHAAVPPATTYNYNQHHPLTPSAQLPAHTPPAHHTPGAGAGALNSGSGTHTPGKPPMTLGLGQLGMNTAMGLLDKLSLRGGQGRGKP